MAPSTDAALELRAYKVCAPARIALDAILAEISARQVEIFYAVRSRPKSVAMTLEKVRRKRSEGKPDYEPEHLTDIVGMRAVTLFREDVIEAVKVFLQMIKHEGKFSAGTPFMKGSLKESIVYTTASVGDPEAITSRLRAIFESMGFPLKDDDIRTEKTGYSSVHLVTYANIDFEGQAQSVPVEIQIRTVFEDAWGEIDHKLRYSLNRSRSKKGELENWQPHLNVLKSFVDGCGQYAGVIKNQAIDPILRPQFGMAAFVPVDNATDALAQIGVISPGLRALFEKAYMCRTDALAATNDDDAEIQGLAPERFIEAAALFSKVVDTIPFEEFETPRQGAATYFFSQMEKAFCLLASDDKAAIDEAIKIYTLMQAASPESVIVVYRYAQALLKLKEYDAAEKLYARAEELLLTDTHVPKDHWLHSLVPRQWGFCIWTRSLSLDPSIGESATRLTLLRSAYDLTRKSFDRTRAGSIGRIRAANNALFYGVEFKGLYKSDAGIEPLESEELFELLAILESQVDLATVTRTRLSWLDTMCRAYVCMGNWEKAVLTAERLEHLLAPAEGSHQHQPGSYFALIGNLNERERDILEHALWVLRQFGPGPERKGETSKG